LTEKSRFFHFDQMGVNLSAQLVPKLRFGNTLVLETLFRLSELVDRNRMSLRFHWGCLKCPICHSDPAVAGKESGKKIVIIYYKNNYLCRGLSQTQISPQASA